ncbi:MAG: homocysteine S-methyltransferase family protein [Desulfuromonadales bacterium]|nr:MAG: homocysteine S-methyltransferase family protein [Desulfuromonadales bacterium]
MRLSLEELLATEPVILGEGAVIERLRRDCAVPLHPEIVNAGFIYDPAGRSALETICRQYIGAGEEYGLPLLLSTPTWRANRERLERAGLAGRDVNGDNVRFMAGLRDFCGAYSDRILIGGLLSCRGDAYNPHEALLADEAREFHSFQADALVAAGVDFLLASTLPALSEAAGLAQAMAASGKPYLVSFVVRPEGTLLDGTPLTTAVSLIDATVSPGPVGYLVNCSHAAFFRAALCHERNSSAVVRQRMLGLLANTAALSPEELDGSVELVTEPPGAFADAVAALHGDLGMKILGGCCGTDDRHIRALASRLARPPLRSS